MNSDLDTPHDDRPPEDQHTTSPGGDPPQGQRAGDRRLSHAMPVGPVIFVVLAAFVVLVGLNLHGSSIGAFRNGADDPSNILGEPRTIRSDEWIVLTPLSVGADRAGLADSRQVGLTRTDPSVAVLGGPSLTWDLVFKPQDLGWVLLDAGRGLAWRWWFAYLVGFLGLLALLRALRVPPWASAGLAAAGAFSPYTAWWSSPPTALLLGFAGAAAACSVMALRLTTGYRATLWSLAGGYFVLALILPMYPPWSISLALVVAALVVGQALDRWRGWRPLLAVAVPVTAVVAGGLGAWYVQHSEAIQATEDTIYPGQRRTVAGGAVLSRILGAPLNFWMHTGENLRGDGTSLPDLSSTWLPIGVVLVAILTLALVQVARRRPPTDAPRESEASVDRGFWTPLSVVAALALLSAWAVIPLPDVVGKVTLLDRVQPFRLPLALGFATIIVLGLASRAYAERVVTRSLAPVWCLGIVATVGATWWVVNALSRRVDAELGLVLFSGLVLAVAVTLVVVSGRAAAGAILLSVYCVASWLVVNPLYRGLGALADEPIVVELSEQRESHSELRVGVFEDGTTVANTQLSALVSSSGAENLSAVLFYPDREFMERFAPGQEALWNNYSRLRFIDKSGQVEPLISRPAFDFAEITFDPCSAKAALLKMDVVVADHAMDYPCLEPRLTLPWVGTGATVYTYDVRR